MRYAPVVAALVFSVGCNCGPTGGNNGTGGGSGSDSYITHVNGSLTGAVTGAITNGDIWIAVVTGGTSATKGALWIAATYSSGSSAGQLTLSSPTGAQNVSFSSSIGFTQVPAAGTYQSSGNSACGGLVLTGTLPNSTAFAYVATSASNCSGSASTASGSWTLTLTSVAPYYVGGTASGTVSYYTVHGSLTGTMPGQSSDASVNVDLTF